MALKEVKDWFSLLQEAPDGIKDYLLGTFWILVWVILIWIILKVLFNKEFLRLYRILNGFLNSAGGISKKIAFGAVESLELPEPYPKVTKFFEIIFMLNTYAAFFVFSTLFLTCAILFATSDISSFFHRTGSLLFTCSLWFCAWFCFAQAERDRVKLFKKQ